MTSKGGSVLKRARYDGPHTAVTVQIPDSTISPFDVERGHLLPTEVDGQSIPAKVRDDLLSRQDWTEVDQKPAKED